MAVDLRRRSIQIIHSGQAKTGAYVASPTFDVYRYAWLRDGSFVAYGMDRAGEHDSARAFHHWVARTLRGVAHKVDLLEDKSKRGECIHPSEWLHCRYTLEGREGGEGWGNFQLDGYGTWLWSLCQHVELTRSPQLIDELADSVDLVIRYLTRFWNQPNFDCWEEHGKEIHPSTLACLYGGLKSVAVYRPAEIIYETCEKLKEFTLTRYVRKGRLTKFADGRSVDANLLWVSVPFGMLDPLHPIMLATVAELERRCFTGGLHRYPEDTYYGGGEWVLLTAWLGWYYVRAGRRQRAQELLSWVEEQVDTEGNLPEQVLRRVNDRSMVQHWLDLWGPVAKPLLWSHAMYLVLLHELYSLQTKRGQN